MIRLLAKRFSVFGAAPFIDEITRNKLQELKAEPVSNTFERTGINPIKDIIALVKFKKQVRDINPDVVLAYTIKPVVFGLWASKTKRAKRFALITGKGSGFESGIVVKTMVKSLYRSALRSLDGVIFQNQQDREFFLEKKILLPSIKSTVIEGTGVDMQYYYPKERVDKVEKVRFLFIARLIREKGIPELVEATKILLKEFDNFEVQLLGWVDPNPGGISQEEIKNLHDSGIVTYLGTTDDIRPYMEKANVFVLPSYYNEGLPRTIQEAMAMGKPIITTDHPGCRETVEEGRNGFLVPIKDAQALMIAMKKFLAKPDLALSMGDQSLQMCKEKFDVHLINKRLVDFMDLNDV